MRAVRSVVAVVLGYLLFAFSAFAFFRITGQPPHQDAPLAVMLGSILVGIVAAVLGGILAAVLAGHHPFAHGIAVALVLMLGAVVSLFDTVGHGAIWSQLAAIFLMAPAAVLGGWLRAKQAARSR